jgi:hypothetical protein
MQVTFQCFEGVEWDEGRFKEEKGEDGEGDPADREATSGSFLRGFAGSDQANWLRLLTKAQKKHLF